MGKASLEHFRATAYPKVEFDSVAFCASLPIRDGKRSQIFRRLAS
jgi:hypothetical protein